MHRHVLARACLVLLSGVWRVTATDSAVTRVAVSRPRSAIHYERIKLAGQNPLGFFDMHLVSVSSRGWSCTTASADACMQWINKKWKEGFYVTSMTTSHTRWAVVMSRNAGFVDQCVELDFQYPSEGIHRRWDAGFRITACAATVDQSAFVISMPRRRPMDETQETLRTSAFPSSHVKEKWAKNLYIAGIAYGRTVS
eukprot:365271-Chlamydomonas_euryale.AAC.7